MYGCYSTHHYTHWDDEGSDSDTTLLGVSNSVDDLRERYNAYMREKYSQWRLPKAPQMAEGETSLDHRGNTGGGLFKSYYYIEIKELEQVL